MEARKALKSAIALAVNRTGARSAIARARRFAAGGRRVVVLGYHRVTEDFEADRQNAIESCLISRRTFDAHLSFLQEEFELASMSRAVEVLTGQAKADRDLAVITFDDGYRDVLENALPVLQHHRAPATLYLSSGVVETRGYFPHDRLYSLLLEWHGNAAMRARANTFELERIESASAMMGPQPKSWLYHLIRHHSAAELERLCQALQAIADRPVPPPSSARALSWDDVRALDACGVEIGAHTTSHCVLTHLPGHDVEADLRRSREAIERALGKPVRHFAYCNGYYNETVIAALKRTGYMSAVTTEDRLNRLGDDPFRIGRRVLWEKSAWGTSGQLSRDLLACQLDDAWSTLGFDASESGQRPEPSNRTNTPHEERRLG